MQLLDLPPELLVNILNFVSPDHFCENVGNVAISKVWYELARPVLLSCIHVSTATLRAGLLRALQNASTLAAAQRYTSTVNIRLDPPRADRFSKEQDVEGVSQYDPGPAQVAVDLEELGHVLHGLSQLRSLRIYPGQHELRVESSALSNLVSLQTGLTSLDIDLANVRFTDDESRSHMCKSISGLMPSLVHLLLPTALLSKHTFTISQCTTSPSPAARRLICHNSVRGCGSPHSATIVPECRRREQKIKSPDL